MGDLDPAKLRVAAAAAALVEDGMVVGLGSGTTAALVVRRLAARIESDGLRFLGVPTSVATAELAHELGITLRDIDAVTLLDLSLDGADEIDSQLRMIKGRGGALLREKIVATTSRRRVTVITSEKQVERLGLKAPIPIEVSAVGVTHTERRLRDLGAETALRLEPDGSPFVTDGGNRIIDCRFPTIDDPARLDCLLQNEVGVFETGLFIGLCDAVLIGHPDRVELVEARSRGRPVS